MTIYAQGEKLRYLQLNSHFPTTAISTRILFNIGNLINAHGNAFPRLLRPCQALPVRRDNASRNGGLTQ